MRYDYKLSKKHVQSQKLAPFKVLNVCYKKVMSGYSDEDMVFMDSSSLQNGPK